MKLIINNPVKFCTALSEMAVAISPKSVVPELSCIRITVEDDIRLFGTTGHISLSKIIKPDSDVVVSEPGDVLVDYSLFNSAVSSIRSKLEVRTTKSSLIVQSIENKKIRRQIPQANVENHPREVKISADPVEVDSAMLRASIQRVRFAMIQEGSRPELNGIYLGEYSMGGDGVRLASFKTGIGMDVTVPAEALDPLIAILPTSGKVSVAADSWISVTRDDGTVLRFSKSTEFPAVVGKMRDQFLQKDFSTRIVASTALIRSVLSPMLVYADRATAYGINYAKMQYSGDCVDVSIDVPDMGTFEDILPVEEISGEEFTILFHPRSLIDILNICSGKSVTIRVFSNSDPLVITDSDASEWVVLQSLINTRETVQEKEDGDDF